MKKQFPVLILFILVSTSFAEEIRPNDSWFNCKSSADCVDIDYDCAGGVVNKSFVKAAKEYYQLMNARANCIRVQPSEAEKKIPYKIFCEKNKCGKQGINPKTPGFS